MDQGNPEPYPGFPEKLDVVIFRENTEDVYAGIEWESGTEEATAVRDYLVDTYGVNIRELSGIGIKPISPLRNQEACAKGD